MHTLFHHFKENSTNYMPSSGQPHLGLFPLINQSVMEKESGSHWWIDGWMIECNDEGSLILNYWIFLLTKYWLGKGEMATWNDIVLVIVCGCWHDLRSFFYRYCLLKDPVTNDAYVVSEKAKDDVCGFIGKNLSKVLDFSGYWSDKFHYSS